MKVFLTPSEVLHVLQLIQTNPLQDPHAQVALVTKVQRPILDALEKEEDKANDQAFQSWSHQEDLKIDELRKEYLNLWPRRKPHRRK